MQTFIAPLKLLIEKDILASLVFGGAVYTVWSMVVASTTGLFKEHFQLDELKLGLVFFPNGAYLPKPQARLILIHLDEQGWEPSLDPPLPEN